MSAWNVLVPTFSWLVAWCSVESTQPSACAYFAIFECPQSLHQPLTESSQPILCQQLCLPDFHQAELLNQYEGRTLTLGSDARCDSPGFSAKFGSYTYGLGDREKCNEVAGSTHMELKGLKRGLQ
nr:uncharacterized protein LOC117681666 [Crassostrea gigas]